MRDPFDIAGIEAGQLLEDWKWLCPDSARVVAVSNFGDVFIEGKGGEIRMLDVQGGTVQLIAASLDDFVQHSKGVAFQNEYFHTNEAEQLAARGLELRLTQCFGFKMPLVLKEANHDPYVATIAEYVSFLGDFHRQVANVPDGQQVRLKVTGS